jgi:hypothetical protein
VGGKTALLLLELGMTKQSILNRPFNMGHEYEKRWRKEQRRQKQPIGEFDFPPLPTIEEVADLEVEKFNHCLNNDHVLTEELFRHLNYLPPRYASDRSRSQSGATSV